MKKQRGEQRELRDRRRKQVLKRIQEQEWESEQWQYSAADEESHSPGQENPEEDHDSD